MSKSKLKRKESRLHRNNQGVSENFELYAVTDTKKTVSPLRPMSKTQRSYMVAIECNTITFGTGFPGTGKTYIAAAMAADLLNEKKISKIIITRPAVEAGESFGFLPGTLDEKYAPYLEPYIDAFHARLGKSYTDYLIKHKHIEAKALGFMRGLTFTDCWALLDEAQNVSTSQMKLFLSRLGNNAKAIISGDIDQSDISGKSGLGEAIRLLRDVPSVAHVDFDSPDDIVRSGIARDIIIAYAGQQQPKSYW
jgi:phosphate starvation-inducible PhoH-like protein